MLLCKGLLRGGVKCEDIQSESAGTDGSGLADASESDKSECAAPDAGEWVAVPFAAADFLIESREAAADCHEHGDRVFCDGVMIAAGSGGDDDTAFVAGGKVNGIEADTGTGEHFEAWAGSDYIGRVWFGTGDDGVVILNGTGEHSGVPEIETAVDNGAFVTGVGKDLEVGAGFGI